MTKSKHSPIHRTFALVLTLSGALLIAGCASEPEIGSGSDGRAGNSSSPTSSDSNDANSDERDDEKDGATAGDVADTAADVAAAGRECLIGTWQMRNETFEATLEAIFASSMGGEMGRIGPVKMTGGSFIRFAEDGTYTSWLDNFVMEFSAEGGVVRHIQNSGEAASYDTDGEFVWVTGFVSVFFEAVMDIDGFASVELDGGDTARVTAFDHTTVVPGVDRELIDGAARFTCESESLELFDGSGSQLAGFTRAPDSTQPEW